MKKQGERTGGSIDEKPPKLDEKTREKTDHLLLLCKRWKTSKTLAGKMVEENQVLIDRDKGFESFRSTVEEQYPHLGSQKATLIFLTSLML